MPEREHAVRYAPGELSPRSGIYRIFHAGHRPDHEAAMLAGERFPKCRICGAAVRFQLVVATKGSAATKRGNPSVLIASDQRSAAGRLRSILRERGFSVAVAADADAAREQLERHACDAVITNLHLGPDRSGLEVARYAKQLSPTPLVFVYTSSPSTEAMREILRTRVDYCVLEPLNPTEVSSALETLMARRSL